MADGTGKAAVEGGVQQSVLHRSKVPSDVTVGNTKPRSTQLSSFPVWTFLGFSPVFSASHGGPEVVEGRLPLACLAESSFSVGVCGCPSWAPEQPPL